MFGEHVFYAADRVLSFYQRARLAIHVANINEKDNLKHFEAHAIGFR
jgi:hypothetical protein